MTPWARFDDLVTGRALVCPPPYRIVAAASVAEVPGVLAEVERATAGGDWAFGYVSYEAAPGLDPGLVAHEVGLDEPPPAWFGLCGEPISAASGGHDAARGGHDAGTCGHDAGTCGHDAGTCGHDGATCGHGAAGYGHGAGPFARAAATFARAAASPAPGTGWVGNYRPATTVSGGRPQAARWTPDWTAEQHARAVEAVREHIAAGDTYQINLTDRLRSAFDGDPAQLYAALAAAQRGRYHAYLDLGRHAIVSASPELFFERDGDKITTRPMKGTAPRGATPDEDREQARRLRASAKERAENVMIVDLLRNDLSRIARLGTVEVTELCALESYPTVWQLTSEITATLQPGTGLLEIFRALFPCGSVTGAPKPSSMRIIRDLEPGSRGVYCGAVGLAGPSFACFNVAIRTAVVDRATGTAVYGAGGGITWDSQPAAEHAELLAKAAVLS